MSNPVYLHWSCALVVAWLSSSALVSIAMVTVCLARLVLGWVTICGWVNHLGM